MITAPKYMVFDWGWGCGDISQKVTRFLGTTSDATVSDGQRAVKQSVKTGGNILQDNEHEMLVVYSDMTGKPVLALMEIKDRTE